MHTYEEGNVFNSMTNRLFSNIIEATFDVCI